jgi:hypothetical protein
MPETRVEWFEGDVGRVLVDGHQVPCLRVARTDGGGFNLLLDERFSLSVTMPELEKWGWFLATGMALGAGMTHFGPDAEPRDPYGKGVRMCSPPGGPS